jgi:hypothetical protein
VDAADYVVWRKTLGQSGENLAADGDGSGEIDAGDLTVWKANFGWMQSSGGTGSATVPEPAAGVMFVVASMGFGLIPGCRCIRSKKARNSFKVGYTR